ncbi:MAG: hypothetical protein LIP23_09540 [Planctomycetes bacterium]|nr:hypothetical protein [Planctomycetota bacterium]
MIVPLFIIGGEAAISENVAGSTCTAIGNIEVVEANGSNAATGILLTADTSGNDAADVCKNWLD